MPSFHELLARNNRGAGNTIQPLSGPVCIMVDSIGRSTPCSLLSTRQSPHWQHLLTHRCLNKMAAILRTTFSSASAWVKISVSWFYFLWYLFARVADDMGKIIAWADDGVMVSWMLSDHDMVAWWFFCVLILMTKVGDPWWRHQTETFSALLALCAGNSRVPGEFPSQRPVGRSLDVFFDLRLNKRLGKQSWGWWFETPSRSWRHCNAIRFWTQNIHIRYGCPVCVFR